MFRGFKKRLGNTNGPRDSGPSTSSHGTAGAGDGSISSFRRTMRKYREAKYDVPQLKSKVLNLLSFDACVEAADSLALQPPEANQEQSSLSRKQHSSGLPDPSVLVSVDGNLLLIPPLDDPSSVFRRSKTALIEQSDYVEPSESTDSEQGNSSPMFSKLMANAFHDYESAVYLGNDIDGDKRLNGFSAMGWSLPASSYALGQCEASLQHLVTFTENILLHRKEAAAKTSQTCDVLREFMPSLGGSPPIPLERSVKTQLGRARSNSDDWEIVDPKANEFVPHTVTRTGPLVAPNSSLDRVLVVLEEYFAKTAEVESDFWRQASTDSGSMLPKLKEAYMRVSDRVQQREEALEEASQRARLLEERLQGLRKEAEQKWAKVSKTEEKAQAKLESLWQERSRQKEKARLEKLHQEGGASQGTTTPPDIDILNLVAQISDDGGSFEPIELGMGMQPPPTREILNDSAPSDRSQDSDAQSAPSSSHGVATISRDEVEEDFKLNELRAVALAADELVEDAAQDLLEALANLDTTRRSARVVAETSMVNAGNAQVQCIREFVAIERKAIEQRLELVKRLEKSIEETETNVRQDLDAYISQDKKDRGGTSHLGDDDDGGIASALALLSSHADANIDGEYKHNDDHVGDNESSASREEIIAALEQFFAEEKEAEMVLDKAVEILCQVAASSNSRSQRSAICYALNSKRSTSPEIYSLPQFDGLCKVFDAILQSYVSDDSGMANAKMLMMLAQTFYFLDTSGAPEVSIEASPSRPRREKRIYVRNRLTGHPIWSHDTFWDEAFRTAMAESLAVSGVMSNFERSHKMVHKSDEYGKSKGSMMRWYDLSYEERLGAASQVHAVICAQLGALAHSMIEFGCGLQRSCAFVRRIAIRNQLPTSQRRMLLQHLIKRHDSELLKIPILK